jgi:acyl carrier protein
MTTAADVRAHILAFVSKPPDAPDDFDLRLGGAVDSLRFIQLIAHLEACTGTAIDLTEIEPELLTNLGVLSRHIALQVGRSMDE